MWAFENDSEPASESKPTLPLWQQLGGGSSIQTWALPLCSQQSFCEKTKGGEENKLGVTSWGFVFVWVAKSWGQSVDSWEGNRKLSRAVPLLKKKREKKKERKEEFMLLLWSQIEVFRCSTWRALGKVSEMAGTVRTSATTDGGFHTATFFYIRWINVTVPDPEHGCKWRGRRTSLSAAMSSEMSSAATYRNPASAEISQRNEILCSSDNPDQASGPLLFPEEPFEKVSSSAEIRSTSALETEKTDPHTSLETTHKEVNGLTDQFNKTALAPTDL